MGRDLETSLTSVCRRTFDLPDGRAYGLRQIADGWECDVWTFLLSPRPGAHPLRLILRGYRGSGAAEKAVTVSAAMRTLKSAGFAVPVIFTVQTDNSSLNQPFVIMQRIDGELLGDMMRRANGLELDILVERFCGLAVHLHRLDLEPDNAEFVPRLSIDGWLTSAKQAVDEYDLPDFAPVVAWLEANRPRAEFSPSMTHGDFHPWNVLVDKGGNPSVIDWTSAQLMDFRFDLAWTLLLASASFGDDMRLRILHDYERLWGETVEDLDFFEAAACGRRLSGILISLRDGPERMGMRPEAAGMMIGAGSHIATARRILRERTGLEIPIVDELTQTRS
jgi:aminoglycoside phosphotransferase (APT) family kinase protein